MCTACAVATPLRVDAHITSATECLAKLGSDKYTVVMSLDRDGFAKHSRLSLRWVGLAPAVDLGLFGDGAPVSGLAVGRAHVN
jgi:hypothetical protein